ncbi:hypothetical protein EV648_106274 [Kribbella sp. VKM Ac-2568]|nr:hypothetical protein EV648_106274 [Kribbella sp. VKM Ac-2568]
MCAVLRFTIWLLATELAISGYVKSRWQPKHRWPWHPPRHRPAPRCRLP